MGSARPSRVERPKSKDKPCGGENHPPSESKAKKSSREQRGQESSKRIIAENGLFPQKEAKVMSKKFFWVLAAVILAVSTIGFAALSSAANEAAVEPIVEVLTQVPPQEVQSVVIVAAQPTYAEWQAAQSIELPQHHPELLSVTVVCYNATHYKGFVTARPDADRPSLTWWIVSPAGYLPVGEQTATLVNTFSREILVPVSQASYTETVTARWSNNAQGTGSVTFNRPQNCPPSATTAAPTTVVPPTVQPTTETPPTVQPTTVTPPTVQPTTETPPTVQPTTETPPTVQPTTETPPTVQPTTETPPTVQPTITLTPSLTATNVQNNPTPTQPASTDIPVYACDNVSIQYDGTTLEYQTPDLKWHYGATLNAGRLVLAQGSAPHGARFRLVYNGIVLVEFTMNQGQCEWVPTFSEVTPTPPPDPCPECTEYYCEMQLGDELITPYWDWKRGLLYNVRSTKPFPGVQVTYPDINGVTRFFAHRLTASEVLTILAETDTEFALAGEITFSNSEGVHTIEGHGNVNLIDAAFVELAKGNSPHVQVEGGQCSECQQGGWSTRIVNGELYWWVGYGGTPYDLALAIEIDAAMEIGEAFARAKRIYERFHDDAAALVAAKRPDPGFGWYNIDGERLGQ